MGKKVAILLLTMMVLTGLSGWYIVGGIQAYSRYQQSSIANQEHCGGQSPVHICVQSPSEIFSSYYPYYVATQSNLFIIHYSSSSPITLVMSVTIVGFSQAEIHTITPTPNIQPISFIPLPLNQPFLQLILCGSITRYNIGRQVSHKAALGAIVWLYKKSNYRQRCCNSVVECVLS